MYIIIKLFSIFLLASLAECQRGTKLAENDACGKGPTQGICKKVEECSTVQDVIKKGGRPPLCGFQGSTPIVCCTETLNQPKKQKSISERKCEEYGTFVYETLNVGIPGAADENITHCEWNVQELIVGGNKARAKVFPHMALIGYGQSVARREWLCGGSLISEKFVLSAAHCVEDSGTKARWVRLGELVLDSETDDATPLDFNIVQSFIFNDYKRGMAYNDIALFKLNSNVVFTPYIRPICLHNSLEINSKFKPIVTGWGRISYEGKFSEDLMQLKVGLVESQECTNLFKRFESNKKSLIPQGIDGELMVCAGGEQGKDSCGGDSGGPLQIPLTTPFCMFSQIGVVSFGHKCALGEPGVYTRVSRYIPWIESIVWPSK